MKIEVKNDTKDIDWSLVTETLKSVGMGHHAPEVHQKAFEASYCTIFLFHDNKMIGFGRAISDGCYQAAIYDCAVIETYQGKGLGKKIVQKIMSNLKGFNVLLYASPGKEGFYQKLGFRKMKTGMAYFTSAETMKEKGFTK